MKAMRSQSSSASSMSCVVSRIVLSCSSLTCRTNACTSRFDRGSSPVVGSSSSISTGEVRNDLATAIFCCCPRDRWLIGSSARSHSKPRRARIPGSRRLISAGENPYTRPKKSRFSTADMLRKNEGSADTRLISERTSLDWRTTSNPKMRASPLSGKRSVLRIRTSVLLPEPFAPRTP